MKLTDEENEILEELNKRAYAIIERLHADPDDETEYLPWQDDYEVFSDKLKTHNAWVPDSVSYRLQDARKHLKVHYLDENAENKANELLTCFDKRFPDSKFNEMTIEERKFYNTEAKKMFDELKLYSIPLPSIL